MILVFGVLAVNRGSELDIESLPKSSLDVGTAYLVKASRHLSSVPVGFSSSCKLKDRGRAMEEDDYTVTRSKTGAPTSKQGRATMLMEHRLIIRITRPYSQFHFLDLR